MSQTKRIFAVVVAVALFGVISTIQPTLDRLHKPFEEKESFTRGGKMTNMLFDESLQFFGAAALGLRQATASMLWVRADEFFHHGEYETIIPLVRMVTWLDPQQIDVYSTGAWHLDYNFVDAEERSDRRYIPPAIKLLEEGIRNNSETYDLYFDLAWMHYFQKIRDYDKAAYWLEKAVTKPGKDPNTGAIIPRPCFVGRMLAHAYEKAGNLDKAEAQWQVALGEAETRLRAKPKDYQSHQEVDVCKKNIGLLLLRRAWRYGDLAAFERGVKALDSLDKKDPQQMISLVAAKQSLAQFKAQGRMPAATQPPVDAKCRSH